MQKRLAANSWRQRVNQQLPLLGHRNWIAIVDSAYPWQTAPGIETIATGAAQLEVVDFVLKAVKKARHVRPLVYLDAELADLPEADAHGVTAYQKKLHKLLPPGAVQTVPHEEIISMLNEAGKTFRVLILKSTLTLPYTSVFVQLDCGYWNAEAESRLRGR